MNDKILWQPSIKQWEESNLKEFLDMLKRKYNLSFNNYQELHEWSIKNVGLFWKIICDYYEIGEEKSKTEPFFAGLMPDVDWFPEMEVNYVRSFLTGKQEEQVAIVFENEEGKVTEFTWKLIHEKVGALQQFMIQKGVKKGDCCVAYLPNIPEAIIAFLACAGMGVIWSSCSPDFGVESVIDRFTQIKPKVFIHADGYHYGGKYFDRRREAILIKESLPELVTTIEINYVDNKPTSWDSIVSGNIEHSIIVEDVHYSHPLWVLYSSGTTGKPKAITHSHGGSLCEHLKYIHLHNEVKPGERFFWFSTTGWMMWNFANASLLAGATLILYEGSPVYPDMTRMWKFIDKHNINHFGTSAPFIVANMKKDIEPSKISNLDSLISIGSTGAPLPPEAFDYVYNNVKKDVWLCSMAGGTDVCTAFVGSNLWSPVKRGKIQGRALGVSLFAYDENQAQVFDEVGEMVITKPMPSMPIYFWNDPEKKRYKSSYFEHFPGIWRHGDWISIDKEGHIVIYGRSDATLNRHGIRIGTSEIYSALHPIEEILDALIVNLELDGGEHYMPLFLVLKEGVELNDVLVSKIKTELRSQYSPRHVPDIIFQVPDIPYTLSGKKLEAPVKKILLGMDAEKVAIKEATKNPEALDYFINNKTLLLKK